MTARLRGVALRLHGPLQAWGGAAIGDDRPTLPFPTRSGVLGMVAACMGIRRDQQDRLAALAHGTRVHVRVDVAGTPLVDDQTIQDHPRASTTRQTIQSKRTYLCDASFAAVVLPGPEASVDAISAAIAEPVFAPFLGRRSCVPSSPLLMGAPVEADDPIGLFDGLERGPVELLRQVRRDSQDTDWYSDETAMVGSETEDFYLDVPDYPGALRRIAVRDDFTGLLPRQWRERFAVHVRKQAMPTRR